MKQLFRMILGIAITVVLLSGHAQAQSGNGQTQILQVNTDTFPTISLSFRSLNEDGSVVEGLSANSISLQENGVPVTDLQLSTAHDTPQILVFIIDTGFASTELNDEVAHLLSEAANVLRDGVDSVVVLEHSDTQPGQLLFGPNNSTLRFREWIPTYQRQRATSNRMPLQSLQAAIEQIDTLNVSRDNASAIVYVGQLIEAPVQGDFGATLIQLQQRAARLGTPIYSFNLGTDDNINVQRVNEIASIQTGSFRLSDGQDPIVLLQDFYSQMSRQRLTYRAQYRVPTVDGNTDRYTISLQINQTIANETYNVAVDPPLVTIVSPAPSTTITRAAQVVPDGDNDPTNDRWAFGVSSTPIQALVSFPDGIARDVISAQLIIDGVPTGELSRTTNLNYIWDISNFDAPGSYPRTIQVSVTDAFGLVTSSASQTINVLVDIPAGVVAPEITEQVTVVVQTACEKDISSMDCLRDRLTVIGPWLGVGILLLLLVSQRQKIAKGAVAAGTQAVRIASFVRDSMIKSRSEPYAEFQVLEGALHAGSTLPMYGQQITFGRDPLQTNVQLYPLERSANERAEPCSISSKHCTVEYDLPNQRFTITDHSRYGTYIKHVATDTIAKLEQETPILLRDNDEITLGLMTANGARLRFKTSNSLSNVPTGRGRIPTSVNEAPTVSGRVPTDVNDKTESQAPIFVTSEFRTSNGDVDGNIEQDDTVQSDAESTNEAKFARTQRAKKLTKL